MFEKEKLGTVMVRIVKEETNKVHSTETLKIEELILIHTYMERRTSRF